jgi:hypothetical protein
VPSISLSRLTKAKVSEPCADINGHATLAGHGVMIVQTGQGVQANQNVNVHREWSALPLASPSVRFGCQPLLPSRQLGSAPVASGESARGIWTRATVDDWDGLLPAKPERVYSATPLA